MCATAVRATQSMPCRWLACGRQDREAEPTADIIDRRSLLRFPQANDPMLEKARMMNRACGCKVLEAPDSSGATLRHAMLEADVRPRYCLYALSDVTGVEIFRAARPCYLYTAASFMATTPPTTLSSYGIIEGVELGGICP